MKSAPGWNPRSSQFVLSCENVGNRKQEFRMSVLSHSQREARAVLITVNIGQLE